MLESILIIGVVLAFAAFCAFLIKDMCEDMQAAEAENACEEARIEALNSLVLHVTAQADSAAAGVTDNHCRIYLDNGLWIEAAAGTDKDYREIYVDITDDAGTALQQVAVIREAYKYSGSSDKVEHLGYWQAGIASDPEKDDYPLWINIDPGKYVNEHVTAYLNGREVSENA